MPPSIISFRVGIDPTRLPPRFAASAYLPPLLSASLFFLFLHDETCQIVARKMRYASPLDHFFFYSPMLSNSVADTSQRNGRDLHRAAAYCSLSIQVTCGNTCNHSGCRLLRLGRLLSQRPIAQSHAQDLRVRRDWTLLAVSHSPDIGRSGNATAPEKS